MSGQTSRRGQAAIAASAIGYGISTALSVVALHGLRPADLLVIELAGSAAVLLTVAAVTGRLNRRGSRRALAQGAVLPGLSFLLGDLGLARTTATSGALLLSVDTIATVVFAVLFLRERIGKAAIAALALGTAGTILVALFAPDAGPAAAAGSEILGNGLVLASVIGSAAFVVWSRRTAQSLDDGSAQGAEDSVGHTAWQFLGATVAVSPFVIGSWWTGGSRIAVADPHELVAAAAVLVFSLGGLLAFNIGIGAVSASRAGLLFTLQPLAGAVTAIAVLGEPLVTGQAFGGALILACLIQLTREGPGDLSDRSPEPTAAAPSATTTR
jgi:drug/metabolite transporter (DMT)-like permease